MTSMYCSPASSAGVPGSTFSTRNPTWGGTSLVLMPATVRSCCALTFMDSRSNADRNSANLMTLIFSLCMRVISDEELRCLDSEVLKSEARGLGQYLG